MQTAKDEESKIEEIGQEIEQAFQEQEKAQQKYKNKVKSLIKFYENKCKSEQEEEQVIYFCKQ